MDDATMTAAGLAVTSLIEVADDCDIDARAWLPIKARIREFDVDGARHAYRNLEPDDRRLIGFVEDEDDEHALKRTLGIVR